MQVGDAIEVPTRRERPEERNETDGTDAVEADPLTLRVELAIQTMIDGICERGPAP